MKNLLLYLLLFFSLGSFATSDILNDIELSIKTNNAKKLAEYFDQTVDITVIKEDGAYSKTQAEQIVKNFLTKHKVKSFQFIHQGESGGDAKYSIGKLNTEDNESYRVYIYLSKGKDGYLIQELRFEEE